MPLILDLTTIEIWIDNKNEVFEDTPYAEKEFRILVEPATRPEIAVIRKKFTKIKRFGTEHTSEEAVAEELFVRQVKKWEGIVGANGKEIPCDDNNKRMIAQKIYYFASLVNLACLNARSIGEEVLEKEAKNSRKSGSGD